jgi:type II secretory pathway pseudopilin PulG
MRQSNTGVRGARRRGTTLIEAMIAMVVIAIGMLGFMGLQVVTARSNRFNKLMVQASAMATDLAENAKRWDYAADSRLVPFKAVTSPEVPEVEVRWDMGRADEVDTAARAQFSDTPGDVNAENPGALGTNYQGLPAEFDVDGDKVERVFRRYWTVYSVNNGKLVQIVVRWKEPGFGWRQVTSVTFRPDPRATIL